MQDEQSKLVDATLTNLANVTTSLSTAIPSTDGARFNPTTTSLVSPTLLNALEQLSQSISTRITPSDFTYPIEKRLAQLRGHSVRAHASVTHGSSALTHLHRRAQDLLLQSYALSFGGSFAAWSLSTLAPSWSYLELNLIGGDVAFGLGTLCVVGSMRWAAGRWEKAKGKWWEAWRRIDEGLSRDIEVRTVLLSWIHIHSGIRSAWKILCIVRSSLR